MNRRSFFGLLGKLAVVAASAKVLPFKVPAARDVITFDGNSDLQATWYESGTCNWNTKTWVGGGNKSLWSDPNNWSVS